jgi:hypothetical protein
MPRTLSLHFLQAMLDDVADRDDADHLILLASAVTPNTKSIAASEDQAKSSVGVDATLPPGSDQRRKSTQITLSMAPSRGSRERKRLGNLRHSAVLSGRG